MSLSFVGTYIPTLSARSSAGRYQPPIVSRLVLLGRYPGVRGPAASAERDGACEAGENILQWLILERGASPRGLKLAVHTFSGRGRGLIATGDVTADEVLLSVPFTSVFQDTETDESSHLSWSGRMAVRLLRDRHCCACESADAGTMCPWIDALPRDVRLPFLHFSAEAIEGCGDCDVVKEAAAMRAHAEATFECEREALEGMGCSWEDVRWAMSVLHSRCFTVGSPAVHLTVPGIDMANHSFQPNAIVRIVHSPDAVQGLDAVEEVCEAPRCPEPSRFELLARQGGIRAGEEITISYGGWPSEVFYLFFGFVPDSNPFDRVVLYADLHHMIEHFDSLQGCQSSHLLETIAADLRSSHGIADCSRLAVFREGFEERLVLAAQCLIKQRRDAQLQTRSNMIIGDVLEMRCREIQSHQQSCRTDCKDVALHCIPDDLHLSVRLCEDRKQLMSEVLAQISP